MDRIPGEENVVHKVPRKNTLRIGVLYPSFPQVALDSLSFQMLYYWLNSHDEIYAEQVMLDFDGNPILQTLETGTPLKKLDYIVVTVHYELDLVNILRILLDAGVEPYSSKREKPIIIAGGPPIIANPLPVSPFIDVLVVGEIESTLPTLINQIYTYGTEKERLLESLEPSKGFFVPSFYTGEKVVLNYAHSLPREFHPSIQLQLSDTRAKWKNRTAVEASRGCFRLCAFCLEGHIFYGVRERPLDQIRDIVTEGHTYNHSRHVKLVSLSFFDHKGADSILEWLISHGYSFSIPSIRAETLNEKRLEYIKQGGQKTLTIAPETGSLKLSALIRKRLSIEHATDISLTAKKLGFTGLKVYLMIGLPGETEDDIDQTAQYIQKLAETTGFKGERQLKITISPFVPKPHTFLQYAPFIGIQEARRRINLLRKKLRGLADIRIYDPRLAQIQTIISRGDIDLSRTLIEWALNGGGLGGWRKAVRLTRLDVNRYLEPVYKDPPWSFIEFPNLPRSLKFFSSTRG
jgi:radical SAM superfamily enzyme YgiQ (UPF0313 family)